MQLPSRLFLLSSLAALSSCVAGLTQPMKIVGGLYAPQEEYGYVAYVDTGKGYCSGVLYADQFLLTAAHCFVGSTGNNTYNVTDVKVTVGISDLKTRTDADIYDVSDIWMRQNYKGMLLGRDLVTVKLARKVAPTVPQVKMITAELAAMVVPGETPAKVIGWGETKERIYGETGQVSTDKQTSFIAFGTDTLKRMELPELHVANMTIMTNQDCDNHIRPSGNKLPEGEIDRPHYIQKHMVCAEGEGKGVCAGDGGGPLIALIQGSWYLYGVASWSLNCAQNNHPTVFTRVSSHLPWINGGNDTILDRRALRGAQLTSL